MNISLRKSNRIPQIICVLFTLALFVSMIPHCYANAYSNTVPMSSAAKAKETGNPGGYVIQRLNALSEMLDGVYFTTTGKSCGNSNCKECQMKNVVRSDHIKALVNDFVPAASVVNVMIHHDYGNTPFSNGASCCGFANFAGWYLFAEKTTDRINFTCICPNGRPIRFTQSALKDVGVKPGDALRFSDNPTSGKDGHSAIFVGYSKSGIVVLDNNYRLGKDRHNRIRTHEIPYTKYTYVCVSRYKNYDKIDQKDPEHTDTPETGKTQYRYHMYVNENGRRFVCPYAGEQKYPGTTFKLIYTEWLDAPLQVNNGSYSNYVHNRTSHCESHGCIDNSWEGDRYMDSDGNTWVCQETRISPALCEHTYSSECDPTCNSCGKVRTISHSFANSWTSDETNHWHVCGVCKETTDIYAHTPGPAATETTPQVCTVCGYELCPILEPHTHVFTEFAAQNPTHDVPGNTAYYICRCDKWFADAEGTEEIEDHDSVVVPALVLTYGDVNHDGRINVTDAVMVMKHRANALTEEDVFCERCANVDTNPKINVSDAVLIMKKRANKDMIFPIEAQ